VCDCLYISLGPLTNIINISPKLGLGLGFQFLSHMTPSSTGKNSELPDEPANVPPSQFGSQKQAHVPITQAFEVIFSVSCSFVKTKCFYGRSSLLLL
jgi:hypothetical protein